MTDVFHSPKLTFERAQHHIRDFERIVAEFKDGQPWAYMIDKDFNPAEHIHKIRFDRKPPDVLACILFDAANNLRAVLDQCGYASAVAGRSQSLKSVKFPFSKNKTEFADEDELTIASNAAADLVRAGKLDEAEQAARDLQVRFPEVHDGYDRLGMVHEARGENRQAADCYRKVIAFVREHPDDYDPGFEDVFVKLVNRLDPPGAT